MDKGYAYFAGGNVYFDTSKLDHYYVFNDHDEGGPGRGRPGGTWRRT